MSTPASTIILQNPDIRATYKNAFDALGEAYWHATSIESKDMVYGAQQAIGEILTAIDEQQLATNTALFIQLTPKIKAINAALTQIQASISTITRNVNTAAMVTSAVSKVLSLFPALA